MIKFSVYADRELTIAERGALKRYLDFHSDGYEVFDKKSGRFATYLCNSKEFGIHHVSVVSRGLIVNRACLSNKSEQDRLVGRIIDHYRKIVDEKMGVSI